MSKLILLIQIMVFALPVLQVNAQTRNRETLPANLDLHIMPLALAHPDPSLRIGAERITGGRWSYGLSAGIGNNPFTTVLMKNDRRTNYQMWEIRPELKFYLYQRKDMGWYLAGEGLYVNSSYTSDKSYYILSFDEKVVFDKAGFRKEKLGGIGKMGVKFLVGRKLTLDLFSGLGMAWTQVSYSDVENPRNEIHDPFFDGEDFYVGKRWTGLLSVGLKLGIRLWESSSPSPDGGRAKAGL